MNQQPLNCHPRAHAPPPTRTELVISILLRAGVILSLFVIVFGLTLSFTHHHDYIHSRGLVPQLTGSNRTFPHTLHETATALCELRGEAFIIVGLLLLIATPVMRVAVSVVAFLLERDWIFVAITSVVLALLILSFFLGRVEGSAR
jgi:uncharacterized membrane protein